jgi:glycosyltransferase involved in cell wall biosynthesis
VSTPVGFVPDLVEDGISGRLVPIGDAGALADAVAAVLEDPVAAARLGLSYTGIERESEYLELTKARLLAEVPEWQARPAIAAVG